MAINIDPKTQKIIVEIIEDEKSGKGNRKRARPEEETEEIGGMLPTSFLRSSVIRRKKEKGIFVYDTGYVKRDGMFRDLEIDLEIPFTPNGGFGSFSIFPTEEDLQTVQDKVLETPLNLFKTAYKKISASDNDLIYGVQARIPSGSVLYSDEPFNENEKWTTEKGLQLTREEAATRLEFRNSDYFPFVGLSGINKNHITDVLDPNAPAAKFVASPRMDVFFMPRLFDLTAGVNNQPFQFYTIAWYYISSKRVAWRDVYYNPGNYPPYPGGNNSQDFMEWLVETSKQVSINDKGIERQGAVNNGNPLEPPVWIIGGEEIFSNGVSSVSPYNAFISGSGFLIALVLQSGKWFYVWGED